VSNESTAGYSSGAEFFRDTAVNYGTEEALGICGRYLDTQLRNEQPNDERQFCRELFAALCEASAGRTDPGALVYPYDFQQANERMESSVYHASRNLNNECARAIDAAINMSCYKTYGYNLELAAMKAVHDFGFPRVNLVLARNFQQREYDGRFSTGNKNWAKMFLVDERAFNEAYLNAHPILVEDFTKYARKLYDAVGAERFALPGRPESGELVHGYEIVRAVAFDDQRGFAIGLNPEAAQQFVACQFTTVENGKREYHGEIYSDELVGAAESYTARILVHMSGGNMKEIQGPTTAEVHTSTVDRENVPGVTQDQPSVLKQIRDAQKAPKPPRKEKTPEHRKNKGDIEL